MQAIEFETYLENGFIQLPAFYQDWQKGKHVKDILLSDDEIKQPQPDKPLSCLDLIQEDVGIIENAPSDLSTNPAYLNGYGK